MTQQHPWNWTEEIQILFSVEEIPKAVGACVNGVMMSLDEFKAYQDNKIKVTEEYFKNREKLQDLIVLTRMLIYKIRKKYCTC
jgi:hypothetical protein